MHASLVKELQKQLKVLEDDLRQSSENPASPWGIWLRTQHEEATTRGRTKATWSEWRDGEVAQAAVAWIVGMVFIRFCEDNGLVDGCWLAGSGARNAMAADNESSFYSQDPTRNSRDWILESFSALAGLPAGRDLMSPDTNIVWRAPISADAATALLGFWRAEDANGALVRDFADPELDTRFLGDVYQDLSTHARKTYALLQTPDFVEELILDLTLTPAMEEFGLSGLKLIDPTCGSGHFLLGAFERILYEWQQLEPATERRVLVQKALDSIHGVDINPFAVAIARFRLTIAALKAAGIARLADAPRFSYHLAVGDSLLYGHAGRQGDLLDQLAGYTYDTEDIGQHPGILQRGRYHVVVGNPPYITPKDKALNEAYRMSYSMCSGKYALTVPFMELFFELAIRGEQGQPAGHVGQITSNSFMKREFGRKMVEELLSGENLANPVDISHVIDVSGAYIPGNGTPSVILIGRRQRPVRLTIVAVLGVRGEPGRPAEPREGLVWQEIVNYLPEGSHEGRFVTIKEMDREFLTAFPWSLSGGSAGDIMTQLVGLPMLGDLAYRIGVFGIMGADDAFMRPDSWVRRLADPSSWKPLIVGDQVRDFAVASAEPAFFPYDSAHNLIELDASSVDGRLLWPWRTELGNRSTFNKRTYFAEGRPWYEWHQLPKDDGGSPHSLVFAFVATHNHFVLDRGGKVLKQSAPVIKLPAGATEEDHLDLLGVLNSSTACFWLRQVSHNKGRPGAEAAGADEPWEHRFEFTGTKLDEFPLPTAIPRDRARTLDELAQDTGRWLPRAALAQDVSHGTISEARSQWRRLRGRLVFEQEELDWSVYGAYGLVEGDLTYRGSGIDSLGPSERAFAIHLARDVEEGQASTTWFTHHNHGYPMVSQIPDDWPDDYRALVQRRLDLIASDPLIGLLERPEYKRRWQSPTFDDLLPDALRDYVLDKLEDPALWSDGSGPTVLSVAQLADRVRSDADVVEAVRLLRDAVEVDLTKELGRLLADEAAPYLAALRYKDSGLRKRAEWEAVWDLQRREDAGDKVSIPVPPKYAPADFRKPAYWKARGKLDVPKERFISYPGAERPGDSSLLIGWAGWDLLDQARALARLIVERTQGEGMSSEQVLPLIAGMVELEPWLQQWHGDPDPAFGGQSPAAFFTGFIDQELSARDKTRSDAKAWRPPKTKGR